MARENKGGKRLATGKRVAGARPAPAPAPEVPQRSFDDTALYTGYTAAPKPAASGSDAVIDEILRSISEQSNTPVPDAPAYQPPRQETGPLSAHGAVSNSYAVAAAKAHQAETHQTEPVKPVVKAPAAAEPAADATRVVPSVAPTTAPVPNVDPSYYGMRDPSQTQSFQPARPTHRDTDRIPTLVEEKPVRKNTWIGKLATLIVAILVIVAIVLGIKMVYILGPSMGWNLPDVSHVPVISKLVDMLPEDKAPAAAPESDSAGVTTIDDTQADTPAVPDPTTLILDSEEFILQPGQSVVVTAILDVENWGGTVTWASSDENIAVVNPIDNVSAEITYVGEGRCWVAALASVSHANGAENPYSSCTVVCTPEYAAVAPEEEETVDLPEEEIAEEPVEEAPAEHIDIVLNREDFTLNVGERHQLMDENAELLTWTSSNEAVATVGETGIVTAVAHGTATITATGPDGTSVSCIARVH